MRCETLKRVYRRCPGMAPEELSSERVVGSEPETELHGPFSTFSLPRLHGRGSGNSNGGGGGGGGFGSLDSFGSAHLEFERMTRQMEAMMGAMLGGNLGGSWGGGFGGPPMAERRAGMREAPPQNAPPRWRPEGQSPVHVDEV